MSDLTSHDDLRTARIAMVGLIGALVTFAVIVLLQVMYYRYVSYESLRQQDEPSAELAALVARQQTLLARYAWVNEQKRIVAIPIERAMDRVVDQWREPRERDTSAPTREKEGAGATPSQTSAPAGGRKEGSHAK